MKARAARLVVLLDWPVILCTFLVLATPVVVAMLPVDPRLASSLLGMVAAGGLCYRFLTCFGATQAAGRVALVLLICTLFLSAIGSYQLHGRAPNVWVIYPLIGHRVACIVAAAYWPRWLGTRSIFVAGE